jgi:DNA-directed RNA polymerase specialized sigma24 family protein
MDRFSLYFNQKLPTSNYSLVFSTHESERAPRTPKYEVQTLRTPQEEAFVEAVHRALGQIYRRPHFRSMARQFGLLPDEIIHEVMMPIFKNPAKFMAHTPYHVANRMAKSRFMSLRRKEMSQRGQGSRGTREVVGDEPVNAPAPGMGSVIDRVSGSLGDSETWVEQDHYKTVLQKLEPLISNTAWKALWLTEIEGLTQAEAAHQLGVCTRTVIRAINRARAIAHANRDEIGW